MLPHNGLDMSSSAQTSLLFSFFLANLAKNPKFSLLAQNRAIAYSYC